MHRRRENINRVACLGRQALALGLTHSEADKLIQNCQAISREEECKRRMFSRGRSRILNGYCHCRDELEVSQKQGGVIRLIVLSKAKYEGEPPHLKKEDGKYCDSTLQ